MRRRKHRWARPCRRSRRLASYREGRDHGAHHACPFRCPFPTFSVTPMDRVGTSAETLYKSYAPQAGAARRFGSLSQDPQPARVGRARRAVAGGGVHGRSVREGIRPNHRMASRPGRDRAQRRPRPQPSATACYALVLLTIILELQLCATGRGRPCLNWAEARELPGMSRRGGPREQPPPACPSHRRRRRRRRRRVALLATLTSESPFWRL